MAIAPLVEVQLRHTAEPGDLEIISDEYLAAWEMGMPLAVMKTEAVAVVVIGRTCAVLREAGDHESTDVKVGRYSGKKVEGQETKGQAERGG